MTTRRFSQSDVFTATALRGNPLAVVHDAQGLSDEQMQALARWTQLSETTFLLPPTHPEADYRVRIFTPGGELPFAGHPTLGSCHAWLAAGGVPWQPGEVIQECGVGLVRVRRAGERLAFAAPPLRQLPFAEDDLQGVCAALGLARSAVRDVCLLDNGPQWLGLLLGHADEVLALQPDQAALKKLVKVGVVAPHAPGASDAQFEVRAFAAPIGIAEDPVTGSLNAALAQWLIASKQAPASYVAAQGTALGRAGRVHVNQDLATGTVWIGGDVVPVVQGQIHV